MKACPLHFHIEYSSDNREQRGQLQAGLDFKLDFDAPRRYFGGDLPPRLVDLLRIGMAVYVVDRLVHRKRNSSQSWQRSLQLHVEVLEPEFWSSSEVLDSLQEKVEFVSGDFWDFEFVKSPSPYHWSRSFLTEVLANESPLICLYSGGLDSAAGLSLRLAEAPDRLALPVTVKHQPGQNELISGQFGLMKGRFGTTIEPFVVKVGASRPSEAKWEPSYRGRAFLFTAAGAIAAASSGASTVEVYESGVGAINVPLEAGMTGSKATRGSHPEFLRRMSRLSSLVARREIDFRLPFFDQTKGEMARALNNAGLGDLARATVSCASYPMGYHPYRQCGVCAACLFRRLAMIVAKIDEPHGTYSYDLFGHPDQVNGIPSDKLIFMKAFLIQAASWLGIEETGQLRRPDERHLRDTKVLKPGEPAGPIIHLLARHRDEWMRIAEDYRLKGCRWANWLAPSLNRVGQGANHDAA